MAAPNPNPPQYQPIPGVIPPGNPLGLFLLPPANQPGPPEVHNIDFVDNHNPEGMISVYGIPFAVDDCMEVDGTIYKLMRVMSVNNGGNPARFAIRGLTYKTWDPNQQKWEPEIFPRELILPEEEDVLEGAQPVPCPVPQVNQNVEMQGGRKKRRSKRRVTKRKNRKSRKAKRKSRKSSRKH